MKWSKLAVGGVLAMGIVAVANFFVSSGPREPVRDGQQLSSFLEKVLDGDAPDAERLAAYDAAAAFGNEAVPWLTWTIRNNDADAGFMNSPLVQWLDEHVHIDAKYSVEASQRRRWRQRVAALGLHAIRPKADPEFRALVLDLARTGEPSSLDFLGPAAAPYLLEMVADPSARVRNSALKELRFGDFLETGAPLGVVEAALMPEMIEAYLQALDDPDLEVRRTAAAGLSRSCLIPVVGPMKIRKDHWYWFQQEAAYWDQIDAAQKQKRMERLIGALDDPDADGVKVSAVIGLGNRGAEAAAAVPKLVGLLGVKSTKNRLQERVVESLRKIGGSPDLVVPAMRGLLTDQKAEIRFAAARTLVRFGVKDGLVIGELVSQLKAKHPSIWTPLDVLETLRESGDPAVDQAWPALIEMVAARSPSDIRDELIPRFTELWERNLPQLIDALAHPNDAVRMFAVLAMPIDDERSKPALRGVVNDRQLREAAMAKLEQIDKRPTGPASKTGAAQP